MFKKHFGQSVDQKSTRKDGKATCKIGMADWAGSDKVWQTGLVVTRLKLVAKYLHSISFNMNPYIYLLAKDAMAS